MQIPVFRFPQVLLVFKGPLTSPQVKLGDLRWRRFPAPIDEIEQQEPTVSDKDQIPAGKPSTTISANSTEFYHYKSVSTAANFRSHHSLELLFDPAEHFASLTSSQIQTARV
ncbi:hypothetical protein IMY05_008G0076000 [Salix suchowensis]|nr:hypothetical protein IMY05_008G0076000 [Salix suchowensis]